MKIACPCGASISDSTDFLPYKAHRFADRDWEDLLDDAAEPLWRRAPRLSLPMWQCTQCGRLCLDDREHQLHWFAPEDPDAVRHRLLSSVHGARWKGHLRGHWYTADQVHRPSGELWWSCGEGDGGWEEFSSRAELERRYDQEFARLSRSDLLRSAFLRVEGHTTRRWPTQDAPDGA